MMFHVGIENNNDDRMIAWALDHPGCFAYGQESEEAQRNFLTSAREYRAWITQHEEPWLDNEVEVSIEETFDAYFITPAFERAERSRDSYMVESCFVHDWKLLVPHEIERTLKLLAWSRADLMSLVEGLDLEKRSRAYPNERWAIDGILKHIGGGSGSIKSGSATRTLKMKRNSLRTRSSNCRWCATISIPCFPGWMASTMLLGWRGELESA